MPFPSIDPLDNAPKAPATLPGTAPGEEPEREPQGHSRQKRGIFTQIIRRRPVGPPRAPSVTPPPTPPTPPSSPRTSVREPRNRFHDIATRITGHEHGAGHIPSQSHAVPKTLAEVTQNLMVADRLHKAGVFPTSPKLATVARDAFINAGVNGLVSAPLSIATYAGSAWAGEAIKGQFVAQTPILPALHQPAPSTQGNAPAAPAGTVVVQVAGLDTQLSLAELRMEVVANNIMAIRQGAEAPALKMDEHASGSIRERLGTLEALYSVAEQQLKTIGEDNDMIFRPHNAPAVDGASSDQQRLDLLGKRFEVVNKFIGKLIVLKSTELPDEPAAGTLNA